MPNLLLVHRDQIAEIQRTLTEILEGDQYNAIHADRLWMEAYGLQITQDAEHAGWRPHLVLDQHNNIIPISVDPAEIPFSMRKDHPPAILFIGGMHWPPNAEGVTWFFHHVAPLLREQIPEIRFYVVGKSPPAELRSLADVIAR